MIIEAAISVSPNEAPPPLLKRLKSLYQDPVIKHGFRLCLPIDDPRTQEAIRLLDEAGRRPWQDTSRSRLKGIEYSYNLIRRYDSADLAECQFLELVPPWPEAINREAIFRTETGEMLLPGRHMPEGFEIMGGTDLSYFVDERTRKILEGAGLRGLSFQPTHFIPRFIEYDENGEANEAVPDMGSWARAGRQPDDPILYWELDGEGIMPPISPSMTFVDERGEPATRGDYSRGFYRKDGFFNHAELHFRAPDLARLGTFDLARTLESFGPRHFAGRYHRPLVASRRFFEVCICHGLRTGWVPVRVDDIEPRSGR